MITSNTFQLARRIQIKQSMSKQKTKSNNSKCFNSIPEQTLRPISAVEQLAQHEKVMALISKSKRELGIIKSEDDDLLADDETNADINDGANDGEDGDN